MKEIRRIITIASPNVNATDTDSSKIPSTPESKPGEHENLTPKMAVDYKRRILTRRRDTNEYSEDYDYIIPRKLARLDDDFTEDSIFSDNCNFNNAIKISREWCKGNDIDNISNLLGIHKSIVSGVYYKASDVAESFIRSNIKEWQIGGPGIIVIIDTYPEGCANSTLIRRGRPILCISEVKSIPQRYWLEALDNFYDDETNQIEFTRQTILQTVRTIVRPGSILVTPYNSTLCCYNDFLRLKSLYPTIVNLRDLSRHDSDEQTVSANLSTIWKSILDVCEEAQFYNSIQQFIVSHMWRRRYGDRSFENFLYQLSLMQ